MKLLFRLGVSGTTQLPNVSADIEIQLTLPRQICRVGDCLPTFQLAWEYLLFDNRVKQARTRLVSALIPGVPGWMPFESLFPACRGEVQKSSDEQFVPIVGVKAFAVGRQVSNESLILAQSERWRRA
jgi:hypothetical protein